MRNDDDMCFVWCHERHLRPKDRRATTITHKDREFESSFDHEGIEFPVKISDIDKIERRNNINISVFGYKGRKQFYPIRISKCEYNDHMELLLLGNSEGDLHYVLISDVNRMLCGVTKNKNKAHFCLHCLHNCVSEEALEKHRETCLQVNGVQTTKFPKEGTKIKFKNHRNSMPVPFVIYADFESILVPEEKNDKSENSEDESRTNRYQTHQACSFGLKTVCHYDDKYSGEYKSYVGKAANVFLKTVLREAARCRQQVNNIFKKKMEITPKQEGEFQVAKDCSICGGELGEDRVRDHCHVTGKYRGAAHNICNLKYRITWKVPVVFHNLRGYDSHLIMPEIEDFRIVGKRWKGEDFNLVTQKGVFPYEFLDDISKLSTKGLPSKDKFYSSLYESEVKYKDYQRAQRVWKHFGMKTMRDYHDLYLDTDVILLADVFENFRRTCLENYKLDPAHYVSAPSLSWDAFLKTLGEHMELVIAFRKAERKLDSSDRMAQLMDFGWDIEKLSKYMVECDEKVLCEYTEDELEEYKNRLHVEDMEEDKIEEKISREIYTSKEKLIRNYEVYLGIREESVERPVRVYKRWLTDVRGHSDEEADEMAEREFSGQPPKIEHQSTKPEEEPEPESEQEEDENDRFIRRRWNPSERYRSKNKDSSRRHRKSRQTKRDRSKNRHSRRPAK
ncbi:Gastrula zinc finger [Paramuricea clavata]|uniref:DNA-directed DNA polymerase n=1 Tax=Paramuricea clavata TaxID=317549 RepID=A0A6S7FR19_PARCT|nr:Gastrula zinc finger [Paramuricea clavata]